MAVATAKKKTGAPVIIKHKMTTGDLEVMVARWKELEAEIEPLEEELGLIKAALVADLDVKDAFTFGNTTLRIIQGCTRTGLNWKKIAARLAKKLFPDPKTFRCWLLDIARQYPKKPTKPYAKIFEFKPQGVGNGKA